MDGAEIEGEVKSEERRRKLRWARLGSGFWAKVKKRARERDEATRPQISGFVQRPD